MSYLQNAPWSSAEKVDLLVNVLQSTIPDLPFFLMQVLHEKGIYPKWNDTPLPKGRSLASSQIIYEEMGRPFKQQGPYNVQPTGVGHVPNIAPALPGRRLYSEYETYPSQQPPPPPQQQQQRRTLQPRPPRSTDSPVPAGTNGESLTLIRPVALPEPPPEPQRKKRGRPSKEEAEERDRALAAEGKVYQPKKRPAKKIRPSHETPLSARTSDIASSMTHTTPVRTPETKEEGSSGKRRSKRQLREEDVPEHGPEQERDESPPPGAQSPSDRLLATHRERDLNVFLTKELPAVPSDAIAKAEQRDQ